MSKFRDIYKLLAYYNLQNPARAKYFNLFEPEIKRSPDITVLEVESEGNVVLYLEGAGVLWTKCASIIDRAVKAFPHDQGRAFKECKLGDFQHQLSVVEWAKREKVSKATVYRWLSNIQEEIERLAVASQLLPENEQNKPND